MTAIKSIRLRLVLFLMIPLSLLACMVALETFFNARKVSNDLHDQTLLAVMLAISENVIASEGDLLAEATLEVMKENLGDQFFYHFEGPNSGFVTGYTGVPRLPEGNELVPGKPLFYDAAYNGNPVRVATLRFLAVNDLVSGWVTITTWRRINQRDAVSYGLFGRSMARFILLLLSAGVIVWFAVSYGLRPLKDLQNAINQRSPSDLSIIKRPMPFELKGIVAAMNDLLMRVARSKTNRERFIGDAAHQLRNPIAALKTQSQTALNFETADEIRGGLQRVVSTTLATEALVEHMLSSAGANSLQPDSFEPVDLVEMIKDIARVLGEKALDKAQDFSLTYNQDSIKVLGHGILLREAATNLVDNAIKHNVEGSVIGVSVFADCEAGTVAIAVQDNGPAFDEERLLRLSQPFATGKTASAGSGLGLSVSKDVAKAHGGQLRASSGVSGEGKVISLILPIMSSKTQAID